MNKTELKNLMIERGNKPSKLTPEQVEHFTKNGMFTATYSPSKLDVSDELLLLVGKRVTIFRNYEDVPCVDSHRFMGEYKFFIEGYKNSGWCPESDFTDIFILPDQFLDEWDISRWNSKHQYLLGYLTRESCVGNFGNWGKTCELPLVIGRSYEHENHDYVKNQLSDPKAEVVLYREFPGEWIEL